jgi:hypothetical protein
MVHSAHRLRLARQPSTGQWTLGRSARWGPPARISRNRLPSRPNRSSSFALRLANPIPMTGPPSFYDLELLEERLPLTPRDAIDLQALDPLRFRCGPGHFARNGALRRASAKAASASPERSRMCRSISFSVGSGRSNVSPRSLHTGTKVDSAVDSKLYCWPSRMLVSRKTAVGIDMGIQSLTQRGRLLPSTARGRVHSLQRARGGLPLAPPLARLYFFSF